MTGDVTIDQAAMVGTDTEVVMTETRMVSECVMTNSSNILKQTIDSEYDY